MLTKCDIVMLTIVSADHQHYWTCIRLYMRAVKQRPVSIRPFGAVGNIFAHHRVGLIPRDGFVPARIR